MRPQIDKWIALNWRKVFLITQKKQASVHTDHKHNLDAQLSPISKAAKDTLISCVFLNLQTIKNQWYFVQYHNQLINGSVKIMWPNNTIPYVITVCDLLPHWYHLFSELMPINFVNGSQNNDVMFADLFYF